MADPTDSEILSALKSALVAIVNGRVSSYSINGRSFTKHNIKDLQALIDQYQAMVYLSAASLGDMGAVTLSEFEEPG